MEPLNRREPDDCRSSFNTRSARRTTIIKVKLMFNGSTSQRMEKACNTPGVYHQLSSEFKLKHDRLVEMTMSRSNL
jgi:hypothetical protein